MGASQGLCIRGRRALALLLGIGAAFQLTAMSSAEGPTIEAAGNFETGYSWRPSTASVGLGGTVAFRNTSSTVPHGLTWTGGPAKPSCTGVALEAEKTNWSGSCTFAQAGTYTFICPVHPTEMKGSISVSATEAPPGPTPPPGGTTESPLQGTVSQALKLAKSQRGTSVRGSINLSPASAGGKFEALLFAKRASLSTKGGKGMSQVGRFVEQVPLRRPALVRRPAQGSRPPGADAPGKAVSVREARRHAARSGRADAEERSGPS